MGGQLKLLGTIFDFDNSGRTQLAKTEQYLTQASSIILTKRAKASGKLHAFNTVAMSKALFTAQHCPWTQADLQRLNLPVNKFYKKVTDNMQSFPNAVLTGDVGIAGLGCLSFDSQTNMRKKSTLHRNLHRKGQHSQAAQDIIHRAFREHMTPTDEFQDTPPLNLNYVPKSSMKGHSWISSLLTEANEAGRSLCMPCVNNNTPSSKPILSCDSFRKDIPDQALSWWRDHSMNTLGDFREFDQENQLWQWSDFSGIGPSSLSLSSDLLNEILGTSPQEDPILRVGQFWMSNGTDPNDESRTLQGDTGNIFEILGFQEQPNGQTLVATRTWKPAAPAHPGAWTTRGTQVYCQRNKDNILCTSSLSLHHVDELFGDTTWAIILGPIHTIEPTYAMKSSVVMMRYSTKPALNQHYQQHLRITHMDGLWTGKQEGQ
jgi:hypothetical protein